MLLFGHSVRAFYATPLLNVFWLQDLKHSVFVFVFVFKKSVYVCIYTHFLHPIQSFEGRIGWFIECLLA